MGNQLCSFEGVDLGYPGKVVLKETGFTFEEGLFYGVVGPNGSGKTTLIKTLLGIIKPLSGKISFHRSFRFGYVPQRESVDELFPLTVWDIVEMSRFSLAGPVKALGKNDREAISNALRQVDIEELKNVPFRSLSGGQKQKTLIARSLAGEPEVLICDEPTNGMDISAEKAIMDVIKGLHTKGMTVIMITHLLNLVADCADVIILLNHHVKSGSREQILKEELLSETYGTAVRIGDCHDRKIIYT